MGGYKCTHSVCYRKYNDSLSVHTRTEKTDQRRSKWIRVKSPAAVNHRATLDGPAIEMQLTAQSFLKHLQAPPALDTVRGKESQSWATSTHQNFLVTPPRLGVKSQFHALL